MACKRPKQTSDSDRMDANDPEFEGYGDDFESDQGDISIGSDTYVSSQGSDGSSSDSDELNAELFQEFMNKLIHCCSHQSHCLSQGSCCLPGLCNFKSTNDMTHRPHRIQSSKNSIVPSPPQDLSKAAAPRSPPRAYPSAREQQQHGQNCSQFQDIPPPFRMLLNLLVGICKMQYDILVEFRRQRIERKKKRIMFKKMYAKLNISPALSPVASDAEEEEELESFDVWMTRLLHEDHYADLESTGFDGDYA